MTKKTVAKKNVTAKVVKPKVEIQETTAERVYDGNCLGCRFYDISIEWFGPKCNNADSPFYGKRRAESATCEVGEAKVVNTVAPVAEKVSKLETSQLEEGLFEVDPSTIRHGSDVFGDEEE